MKVVLLKNIPRLGSVGEIKEVKDGYALNYLLPKNLAALPDKVNIAKLKKNKKTSLKSNSAKGKISEALNNSSLELRAECSPQGTLYASIDKKILQQALNKKNIKTTIHSMQPVHLKDLGDHTVKLTLDQGLQVEIKVIINKK